VLLLAQDEANYFGHGPFLKIRMVNLGRRANIFRHNVPCSLPMKTSIFLLLVLAAAAGCESTPHYNRTKVVNLTPPLAKRPYGTVKLYQDKSDVPGAYDVMAMFSVEGKAGDEAAFLKAFLYRAADLGADGLILYRGPVAAGTTGGGWMVNRNGGFGMPGQLTQDAVYRGEAIHLK